MKYEATNKIIRLPDRKALNLKCLDALADNNQSMTPAEIFHSYTGIGGLHGLNYVDFSSYYDFSEAKKEIEQGQFFTPDALCAWVVDCIRPDERHKIADLTCGKGSFFNHLPNEENIYGCEIEPDSYAIASNMFDKANLKAMKIMEKAHQDAEEMFISAPEPDIRLLDFKKTEDEDDS